MTNYSMYIVYYNIIKGDKMEYDEYMQFQSWMVGGQIDSSGNSCEGWDSFHDGNMPPNNKLIETIETLVSEFGGNAKFNYWGGVYNFTYVSTSDIQRLAKYIMKGKR